METFKPVVDYTNRSFFDACDQSHLEYRLAMVGIAPEAAALVGSASFRQTFIALSKASPDDLTSYQRPAIHAATSQ